MTTTHHLLDPTSQRTGVVEHDLVVLGQESLTATAVERERLIIGVRLRSRGEQPLLPSQSPTQLVLSGGSRCGPTEDALNTRSHNHDETERGRDPTRARHGVTQRNTGTRHDDDDPQHLNTAGAQHSLDPAVRIRDLNSAT